MRGIASYLCLLVVAAGCGRVGFVAHDDASSVGDGAPTDALVDAPTAIASCASSGGALLTMPTSGAPFVVPMDCTALVFHVVGGQGAQGSSQSRGGTGAIVDGTIPVIGGEMLTIAVGGGGVVGGSGGVNGGGNGGPAGRTGSGGGGFSGIARGATWLVIAGGGGGGGGGPVAFNSNLPGIGGAGGAADGSPGQCGQPAGGIGATMTSPGAGGISGTGGTDGAPGASFVGGIGGMADVQSGGGGGGGGGWYGGGGGGGCRTSGQESGGGGGGGSSYADMAATTGVAFTPGSFNYGMGGNGSVQITVP